MAAPKPASSFKFRDLVASGQKGEPTGFLQGDVLRHEDSGVTVRLEWTAEGKIRKHETVREAFYFLDVNNQQLLQGDGNYATGPRDMKKFVERLTPQNYVYPKGDVWTHWLVVRPGQPSITLKALRDNWHQNYQQTHPIPQTQDEDVEMTDDAEVEAEAAGGAGEIHNGEGLAAAGDGDEAATFEGARAQPQDLYKGPDFSARSHSSTHPPPAAAFQSTASTLNQGSFDNHQVHMASNIPDELIDPALLNAPNPTPTSATTQSLPDNTTAAGDITMTEEVQEATPITTANPHSVLEPIRNSVHNAALEWLQALPAHVQANLPTDPIKAFRRALDDCNVIEPWSRHQSVTTALRVAAEWFPSVPPVMLKHLPSNSSEAFISAVLRLTPTEIVAAQDTNMAEPTDANADDKATDTATSFEKSRKTELKGLEEWK